MKAKLLNPFLILSLFMTVTTFAQVGIGTDLPDKSAALEIKSEQRGLLIPRLDISDLESPDPVTDPADALLIFNENPDHKGFYYWDDDAWTPLAVSEGSGGGEEPGDFSLKGEGQINIAEDDGAYTISLNGGEDKGEILVTAENEDGDLEPKWMEFEEFVDIFNISIGGDGGSGDLSLTEGDGINISGDDGEYTVGLGGSIENDIDFIMEGSSNIRIENLREFNDNEDLVEDDYNVMVMDENGILQQVSVGNFQADAADIGAENGLQIDDGKVVLGGELTEETTIEADYEESNTLNITGLEETEAEDLDDHDVMLLGDNGVLKRIAAEELQSEAESTVQSIAETISSSTEIDGIDDYDSAIPEVLITVDNLSDGDVDLTMPSASEAEGQVINVKLTVNSETDNYLNIKDGNGNLTYGALPHQSWVLKSDGSNWQVVASN